MECIEGQRCGISIAPAPPAGKRGGFSIFNSKKYDFEIWRNTILQIGEIPALSRSDQAFALELSKAIFKSDVKQKNLKLRPSAGELFWNALLSRSAHV